MSAFERAMLITLGAEGGYSNNLADRGGSTMAGITQRTYDSWRRRWGKLPRPVKWIEPSEVRTIAHDGYWALAHCDELPDRLAICVFDAAFNHGPGNAIRLLQRALEIQADGYFGPKTREAVKAADEAITLIRYLDARQDFYDDIVDNDPSQAVFSRGWANRVAMLRDELSEAKTQIRALERNQGDTQT